MGSKMRSLLPLATMLAGAALTMVLIGTVVGRLDGGQSSATQGRTAAAAPSR
jgi:hypothetical protein